MEKRQQVFEEWDVDCNDCKHYWDDTCDACSEGSRRLCNSFVATRRVVLPAKIERLEMAVRSLRIGLYVVGFFVGVLIGEWLGIGEWLVGLIP